MELSKLFKGLIILQFVSLVAMVMVVPEDPASYEEALGLIDFAALIYLLLWLVSLVLLFRFQSSARTLFTIAVIIGFFVSLGMSEPSVPTTNLVQIFNWIGGALDGAMLAILYLTNIKERFKKMEEQ
tara:strand:+ start:193 stop:573 length:381 start_codon:yes stop_codon:yes gene_type:complete